MVVTLLKLVNSVAEASTLSAPARRAALAHLLSYMSHVEQQEEAYPHQGDISYHNLATQLLDTLTSSSAAADADAELELPYSAVSVFVPLLRGILRRHPEAAMTHQNVRLSAFHVLRRLFSKRGRDGETDDDAQRRSDLADFAGSDEFEFLILDFFNSGQLKQFVDIFDDDAFARAFTSRRIELIIAKLDAKRGRPQQPGNSHMSLLEVLAARSPAFAQRLACLHGFALTLKAMDHQSMGDLAIVCPLQGSTLNVFESILDSANDISRAAQQLLASGAVKTCCAFLMHFVMQNPEKEKSPDVAWRCAENTAQLLRLLRVMICTSDTAPDPAARDGSGVTARNPFAAQFVAWRGPQALALLRYDGFMQQPDFDSLQREAAQLRALLVKMAVVAPDAPAAAELRQQALAGLREFTQAEGDWQKAFNAHLACSLEEAGYPRRISHNFFLDKFAALPAPARASGAPSAAALPLLQAKARERLIAFAREKLRLGRWAPDVVLTAQLHGPAEAQRDEYRMVIRLDDARFPCNAAHFRVAALAQVLGDTLHTCFVPPGASAAALPFVTMYCSDNEAPTCVTAPLLLPESDIVYGEYAEPTAAATYAVGTVLTYPRTIVPGEIINHACSYDAPWFIVFKPCPASLLRGAVPVGRVMSCVAGGEPSEHDSGDAPFDAAVLACFETRCRAESCSACQNTVGLTASYRPYKPMQDGTNTSI